MITPRALAEDTVFELNPLYSDLREARGSALEARTNLLALDWI